MMPDIKALLLAPEARTGHWPHRVRNIGVANVAHTDPQRLVVPITLSWPLARVQADASRLARREA